jgi:hypothetical protein
VGEHCFEGCDLLDMRTYCEAGKILDRRRADRKLECSSSAS